MKAKILFFFVCFLNAVFVFSQDESAQGYLSSFETKKEVVKNTDLNSPVLEKIKWFDLPVLTRYYIYNNYKGCTIDSFQVVAHHKKGKLYEIKIHKDQNAYYFLFNQKGDLVKMRSL